MFAADRKRVVFAIFATIALVLQSLGSAWASAQPSLLDAFGNPLCINDGVDGGGHSGDHGPASNCCAIICSGCASPLLPPQAAPVPPAMFRLISEALGGIPFSAVSLRHDHDEGNPRAPPLPV